MALLLYSIFINLHLLLQVFGYLEAFCENEARLKGSIAEAYIVNESMTFCPMHLRNIETKFNRDRHFEVEFKDEKNVDKLSFFF